MSPIFTPSSKHLLCFHMIYSVFGARHKAYGTNVWLKNIITWGMLAWTILTH